ncbi:aminopeptidase N-like [Myzus persicae]|uniref:aminopeptidase N-like n=1 Tax=Myzus persicae TaxID=13164 RepID=UPI000B931D2D|nr:aminopeptidase N-like [Myzus persicae]
MMFKLVAVLSAALLCVLVRGQADPDDQKMDVFRLPEDTRPLSYDLWFAPNISNSSFEGRAKIVVEIIKPDTDKVTLNFNGLSVTSVLVTDVTNPKLPRDMVVTGINYLTKNEQFEIRLQRIVPINKQLLLTMNYTGRIRDDMIGLYKSSYVEDGVTKWLAVTQFEARSARMAFPCYDEPMYKAKFNISVVKQKNQTALSNMPIVRTEEGPENTTVNFSETPLMSTYLAAIYVGQFVPNQNDSKITIYTHETVKDQTEYVATEAPKHLKALEEYTGINYMLPKMDLLAIPDFRAGAMENWGLNTYREFYLLLSNDSKTRSKIRASEVVQHEFTHQWFGNLVTCKWWDYTWLNEGFARYFQYFATGMVRTSWLMEELFVVETNQNSLGYDQTPRHPITSSVNTPEEIDNVFDTITYGKAASVLRMLKYVVSENLFQLSLQNYLSKFSYSAADPGDLYSSFDNILYDHDYDVGNGLTVSEFMSNWTLQSGYPVLNVTRNATTKLFFVTQARFYVNQSEAIANETAAWHICLTYTTDVSKNFTYNSSSVWTNKESALTVFEGPAENISWYIFNPQSIGFYRVNYEVDNWMALIQQLNRTPTDIHVLNRAQLIDDAFNLARSGQLDYSVPLHLSKYLKNENNTTPWYSAMNGFSYLLERMPRSGDEYEDFKSHVSSLAGTIYKKLEDLVSNGNTEFRVLSAWETFSTWACRLENKYCTTKAQEYFNKWQAGEKIPADIKDAAFCIGVKNSKGPTVFDNMLALYNSTNSISEKSSVESALGCSTNKTQLSQYINHILDGPNGLIKTKDMRSVVSAISVTPLGLDVLYEFMSVNINTTMDQLPNGEDIITFIYSTLASKMTDDDQIEKIKNFKNNSTLRASVRPTFENSYKVVEYNLEWFNSYSDGINQWASQYGEKEPEIETTTLTPPPVTAAPTGRTVSPVTSRLPTTTSAPSSATLNAYSSLVILQLTVFAVFIKTYLL